jgi:hypothetical protein
MSIQGDGNAVHKAKDHSRALSPSGMEILARDGELDALKGACPVREGLH